MSTGSGIAGQFGLAEESTYGTAVTVTRFYELLSEGIDEDIGRIQSNGIRSEQRVIRSEDWTTGAEAYKGPVELELQTKNIALLGKHMFGTVVTAGAGPYTHTLTPGDLTGKSLTMQVGRPDTSGTVRPFTFAGCKIAGWELSCEPGEDKPASLKLDVLAKSRTTATALATASYTSSNQIFAWTHASLTIAAAGVQCRGITLKGTNPMRDDRYALGQTTIDQPIENAWRDYTGTIKLDFDSLTHYNRFANGTEAAVVLSFVRSTDSIVFTMNCRFDKGTPALGDRDLLGVELDFKCVGPTTDASAITCVITSSESTP